MGYRVEYGPVRKVRGVEKRISGKASLIALCFLGFSLMVGALWPEGACILRKLLFPGDPVVTAAALETLAVDIQAGADLSGSLRNFCLEILKGAKCAAVR